MARQSHGINNEPVCLLMDNGSLKPEATLNLRHIAEQLTALSGHKIRPISLLHSSSIKIDRLNCQKAELFEPTVRSLAQDGVFNFIVIPLFFGPSRALTRYLPDRITHLKKTYPQLKIRIAKHLVDVDEGTDFSMSHILTEGILRVIKNNNLKNPAVILVDHGTPEPAVNKVRIYLTRQLNTSLRGKVREIASASMERRAGDKYSFNDPLLEHLLDEERYCQGDVIIALLFFSPGHHAAANGDIAIICQRAEKKHLELTTYLTGLIGQEKKLIPLLKERLEQELNTITDTRTLN